MSNEEDLSTGSKEVERANKVLFFLATPSDSSHGFKASPSKISKSLALHSTYFCF
jgi:hypothetical protein